MIVVTAAGSARRYARRRQGWVTGSGDNSRDFQDYLLDLAVKLAHSKK